MNVYGKNEKGPQPTMQEFKESIGKGSIGKGSIGKGGLPGVKMSTETPPPSTPTPPPPLPSKGPKPAIASVTNTTRPASIDPTKTIDIKDIPSLFKTIERMMSTLTDLQAEFHLKGPLQDFWLVPSYTEQDRDEIAFEDAARLTVLCAAFGGTVTEFRFLSKEEREAQQAQKKDSPEQDNIAASLPMGQPNFTEEPTEEESSSDENEETQGTFF